MVLFIREKSITYFFQIKDDITRMYQLIRYLIFEKIDSYCSATSQDFRPKLNIVIARNNPSRFQIDKFIF